MNTSKVNSGLARLGDSKPHRNPFVRPRAMREIVLSHVRVPPILKFDGKGFVCALINSRCHVGCAHCMFSSNMAEGKNKYNTMTQARVQKLMQLVSDSNTGYLLVSGGGEGFLESSLMYQIVENSTADLTWVVTSAFWAKKKTQAVKIINTLYQAYTKGNKKRTDRRVCLRVSFDVHHVSKLAGNAINPFNYICNIIKIFESTYSHQNGFFLQLHCIESEKYLVEQLRQAISAVKVANTSLIHRCEKATESAITFRLPTGYEFEVTYAKLLLSDITADMRDTKMLKKRIQLWEKDAFGNEQDAASCQINSDGSIGTDMLVIYDGRVAGGWQSEMPDVPINIDFDSYESIMNKTLSDPGVLATIERGLAYRFEIIDEVCPKACIRAKAINIRDYTSLVLLEEDAVKLYYTLRAIQDFCTEGRIEPQDMGTWPLVLKNLIGMPQEDLQFLYRTSGYDLVKQFEETEPGFAAFLQEIRVFAEAGDSEQLVCAAQLLTRKNLRRLDKWRILIKRIVHEWYDIKSLNTKELSTLEEVERLIDSRLLHGLRIYEGLSRLP